MWTIFTFTYLNGAMPQKMPFYFILLANKKKHKNNSIELSIYHISIMEMSGLMTQSHSAELVSHSNKRYEKYKKNF